MKSLFSFLLSLFFVGNLHSQNCTALSGKTFFNGIKLGGRVPGGLIDCSGGTLFQYPYYNDYRLDYDSLKQNCKKKYGDFFKFQNMQFSFSSISTNKKGKINNIELYTFFEDEHSNDSIISNPPGKFITLFNKLVSLYGKPTSIQNATGSDSLFIKELGISRLIIWECDNESVRLRLNYGARNKDLNVIDIQIGAELIEETELQHQ